MHSVNFRANAHHSVRADCPFLTSFLVIARTSLPACMSQLGKPTSWKTYIWSLLICWRVLIENKSYMAFPHNTPLGSPQTLILTEFEDWPGDSITVEFWMLSADKCRKGVPFSYATGEYEQGDNSFLILNYNDWCAACIAQLRCAGALPIRTASIVSGFSRMKLYTLAHLHVEAAHTPRLH